MKTKFYYLSIVLAVLAFSTLDSQLSTAHAQGTAFTYQGRLNDGVNPASGSYDVKFTLFDTNTTGTILAAPFTNTATAVSNGSFIVTLDFGSAPFDGNDRWLEIAVRTNGGGSFSTLTPRQPVTAVPYAINSLTAGSVAGLRVTGNLNASPNVIGGASANYVAPAVVGATIAGGGATGSGVSNSISGDYSTIGGGLNNTVQNIKSTIGGGFNNIIEGDSHFAIIGGGSENKIHFGSGNGTIAGGYNNALQSPASYSFIGGGNGNYLSGPSSAIVGGNNNTVQSSASGAAIGGGNNNSVNGNNGTVPGGDNNNANGVNSLAAGHRAKALDQGAFVWADSINADFASTSSNQFLIRASGGVGIGTNNPQSALHVAGTITASNFVGSGAGLTSIADSALSSNVVRAVNGAVTNSVNFIGASNQFAGKFSGDGSLLTNVNVSMLGGLPAANFWQLGGNNVAPGQFMGSTNNLPLELRANNQRGLRIEPNTNGAPNMIGGSAINFVAPGVVGATIAGGGATNFIMFYSFINSVAADYGFIGGGHGNTIQSNANESSIGGGYLNTIQTDGRNATIGGGQNNTILPDGGFGTIPGGVNNSAASFAFAAGRRAQAVTSGSFVWADSIDADFASTANNQFLIRASGGVGIGRNNPATALDVNGIVNATDFYKNGSPFGSSLWVSSGGNIYYSGGNVGIGTTTPGTTLHVQAPQAVGRFQSTGSPNGSVIEIWNNTAGSAPAGAINFIKTNTFRGQIGYLANDSMTFTAGGVERMRISGGGFFGLGAGNVGIGTANPGAKLEIQSDFDAEVLRFGLDPTDYHSISTSFHGSTPAGNYLGFNVEYNSSDTRRVLTLRGDGNVGIGTEDPTAKLHVITTGNGTGVNGESASGDGVSGNSTSGRGVSGYGKSGVYGYGSDGNGVSGVSVSGGNGVSGLAAGSGKFGVFAEGTGTASALYAFTTANDGLGCLIGTPSWAADMYGGVRIINGGGVFYAGISNGIIVPVNGQPAPFVVTGGASFGSGPSPGGYSITMRGVLELTGNARKDTGPLWDVPSDARIKTDVQTLSGALEKLNQVRLVSFRYNDEYRKAHPNVSDRQNFNVIAQEFQKVFPDYVKPGGEKLANGEDLLRVDAAPLMVYSAAAIQELHGMVKAKEAQIAELSRKNQNLEKRLEAVEKFLNGLITAQTGGER